jgi:hypothetical protein
MLDLHYDDEGILVEHVCPRCGGKVRRSYTCGTWQDGNGTWMSCLSCNSATRYECVGTKQDEDGDLGVNPCDWAYVNGLNLCNPDAARNHERLVEWQTRDKVIGTANEVNP